MIKAKFGSFSSLWRSYWPLGFLFLLLVPIFWPFFHRGFFPSHDNVQVVRVFELVQSLRYGDIPARWSSNLLYGHGYPLYVFYSPLSYLIGAAFSFLGFNFLISTKLVFILGFLLGGLGMYLLVMRWWGKLPALIAALVFSYTPYRALDVYVRGNLAEFFSLSLFPFVVLVNYQLLTAENKGLWRLVFSFSLFLLFIAHNISAFIFGLFLLFFNLFYFLFCDRSHLKEGVWSLVWSGILAAAISCFYWLPLIYETRFVMVGKFAQCPYWRYFLTLGKIWDTPWGFGGYIESNPMSLQLGKTIIVLSFLALLTNFFIKTQWRKIILFIFGALVGATLIELPISDFLWHNLKILPFLQFPWRFHVVSTYCGSILFAAFFYLLQEHFQAKKWFKYLFPPLLLIALSWHIFENYHYFKPNLFWSAPAVSESTTWDDEYLPRWVRVKPKDYASDKVKFIEGKGKVEKIEWGYLQKSFVVNSSGNSLVEIAHIYYPGWQAFVNGQKAEIKYDNEHGLMRLSLLSGKNQVVFKFLRTPWRLFAEAVSLLGLGIYLWLGLKSLLLSRFFKWKKK
jgi:hypothetical protein